MQKRHSDSRTYFNELSYSCEKHYIPYIKQHLEIRKGLRVLEIGCGEGGNLLPFAQLGCEVCGIDINGEKIKKGNTYFVENNFGKVLQENNFFDFPQGGELYDLILIHDVIEHIHDQRAFLAYCTLFLNSQGLLFLAFPPWQMPFGGHQQICTHSFLAKLPFIHLLPNPLYKLLFKIGKVDKEIVNELLDIKECRLSIEKFRDIVQKSGLQFVDERFYFINPHYEIKFGLKARRLNKFLGKIPYLRNFYTSSCFALLKKGHS